MDRPSKAAPEPPIDEDVTGAEINSVARRELRTLSKDNAAGVAQHMVMIERLIDADPEKARAHADHIVGRAGRVASVREARGMVAYSEGDWRTALKEFRTAQRLSGRHHLLPHIVDCERALGRHQHALDLARSPESLSLEGGERIELDIVVAGIRRDLGDPEAALLQLRGPELDMRRRKPWSGRLFYAYGDTLEALGRSDEAREWFAAAVDADPQLGTDAAERLDELDGTVFLDLGEDEDDAEARETESGSVDTARAADTDLQDSPDATAAADGRSSDGERADGTEGDGPVESSEHVGAGEERATTQDRAAEQSAVSVTPEAAASAQLHVPENVSVREAPAEATDAEVHPADTGNDAHTGNTANTSEEPVVNTASTEHEDSGNTVRNGGSQVQGAHDVEPGPTIVADGSQQHPEGSAAEVPGDADVPEAMEGAERYMTQPFVVDPASMGGPNPVELALAHPEVIRAEDKGVENHGVRDAGSENASEAESSEGATGNPGDAMSDDGNQHEGDTRE